jgi:hypothetical protein
MLDLVATDATRSFRCKTLEFVLSSTGVAREQVHARPLGLLAVDPALQGYFAHEKPPPRRTLHVQ